MLTPKATTSYVDAQLRLKANQSTTYTKTGTDNLLTQRKPGYNISKQTETDNLLLLKANQATTYTKTETDAAIANKANAADMTATLALKSDKPTTYTTHK